MLSTSIAQEIFMYSLQNLKQTRQPKQSMLRTAPADPGTRACVSTRICAVGHSTRAATRKAHRSALCSHQHPRDEDTVDQTSLPTIGAKPTCGDVAHAFPSRHADARANSYPYFSEHAKRRKNRGVTSNFAYCASNFWFRASEAEKQNRCCTHPPCGGRGEGSSS
jgi:hypothetical protein